MKKYTMSILIVLLLVLSVSAAYAQQEGSSNSVQIQLSMLNQDPNPARAGEVVKLRFKLENTGRMAANNVYVELMQDYPFTVVGGNAVDNISSIDAFQTGDYYSTVDFTVKIDKDAVQGEIPLQVRYRIGDSSWTTLAFSVNVASKQFAQMIYVDKAKLQPGRETNLTFTVTNTGNAPLQNMVFSWNDPKGVILPVYSSDTKYVKYLDSGESVSLNYVVIADVNANPGLYQLNLNLQSETLLNATTSTITTKAGIFVGGETDFDVAFSESTAGQTSLSVSNIGNNPAQSVSVVIPQQENFRVSGTNSAIIGNLDKGDYTLVSFQIAAAGSFNQTRGARTSTSMPLAPTQATGGNAAGRNVLIVDIEYTDTTGERRTVEKNVPIQFRATTTGTATGTTGFGGRSQNTGFLQIYGMWIIIIVLLIIIVFLVVLIKSKAVREKVFGIFSKKKLVK